MNKHPHSFLWRLCISCCIAIGYCSTTAAQQVGIPSTFDLPTDRYYGTKTYAKGIGKSFFNFGDVLVSRAVLPAASFAEGPTSGQYIGRDTINGQSLPFVNQQPIQGFSSIVNNYDSTFTVLSDNGFGSIENSADYHLRLYIIRPRFKSIFGGGSGTIDVLNYIELKDPNHQIPFAITNHFSTDRVLTGADFDIESIQRTANGDFWIGDEFGPFLLHFDKNGVLLAPPYALPDFETPSQELRSPQNPYSEEASAIRIMNAMRAHAATYGSPAPVMSPWHVMLDDQDTTSVVGSRSNPPVGLQTASSELFDITSLNKAGHPVVVYTVNDFPTMQRLLKLGVQGIITDRPDLLRTAVEEFDGDQDGKSDYIDADGLIDGHLFDAQGHRGARSLRPENTIPSMEAALDALMPTLETDCGITLDGIAVLDHDPHIEAAKTRKADGTPYEFADEVLVKDLTLATIQQTFIADKILAGRPAQTNERALSPVAVAFASQRQWIDPYIMPSLQQVFDFVAFYIAYYKNGQGATHPEASKRWKNAAKVRYNIETKTNPRTDTDARGDVFADRTVDPATFTTVIANTIIANGLENRADIQSFDFRTLLIAHKQYPAIRTVCLFGDFPKVGAAGDGTNLQDMNGQNTPWLAGMYWPYRSTQLSNPFKVRKSGGFEGMAITPNQQTLLPLLEKPLATSTNGNLLLHEFDIASASYTGTQYEYPIDARATAIGDFILFNNRRGVVIERDGSQGDLNGFKAIYEVAIDSTQKTIAKRPNLDLLNIRDIRRISTPGLSGDVGIGRKFAFPFVTIESVVVFNPFLVGVLNDNNYPFSIGRHVGTDLPDDNEFILVWLNEPLGRPWYTDSKTASVLPTDFKAYPNTFTDLVTFSFTKTPVTSALITIYDRMGNQVCTLAPETLTDSKLEYVWDGTASNGQTLASGIYIAIAEINGTFIKKKLIKR